MPRCWLLVILIAAGCTTAVAPTTPEPGASAVGGTLRVGLWAFDDPDVMEPALLDPQRFYWHPFARCCLLRTLLSYEGRAIEDGGAQLRPDLAEAMPEISLDGLTWSFRLREGLRYAPPFENRAIVARDFITALERTVRVGESPYHDVIAGVGAFRDGQVGTISGVEAPDERTLVFHLTEPAGDFGNRVAMTYLAPIPEEALAAHGDDYGGYLVASGPYMIEGADAIDHDDPDAAPTYASDDMALVRNPSWSAGLDPLRPAHVDRIEVAMVADRGAAARDAIESGEIDIMLDPMFPGTRDAIAADPEQRSRLREVPNPVLFFIPLNLAQPPFDDVEVRRAVHAVIDREALLPTFDPSRGSSFAPASHAFPDVAVGGLLRDYVPEGMATGGDIDLARAHMAQSAYDTDGDGTCDGDVCTVLATRTGGTSEVALDIIETNLGELGIRLEWVDEPFMTDPTAHIGLGAIFGWVADYPSANDFVILISTPGPDGFNPSLVGATPAQLDDWGYATSAVPSLDDKIGLCRTRGGSAAFSCWAELDQLISDQVIAWVPVATSRAGYLLGSRIDEFEASGAEAMPALDRITLATGSDP